MLQKKTKRAMSLNVKNPEAHRLAQSIARTTGETMTHAVTEALRERYERLQNRRGKASVEELLAIAQRASAQVKGPYLDHATFLYDQRGLPK
jgi:antitoxin VapB